MSRLCVMEINSVSFVQRAMCYIKKYHKFLWKLLCKTITSLHLQTKCPLGCLVSFITTVLLRTLCSHHVKWIYIRKLIPNLRKIKTAHSILNLGDSTDIQYSNRDLTWTESSTTCYKAWGLWKNFFYRDRECVGLQFPSAPASIFIGEQS